MVQNKTLKVRKDRGLGNLRTPESVRQLQTALYAKAKEEPEFRFYMLYDKIFRIDVLGYAYVCCCRNKGAAGVDGQTFDDIETYGEEKWLGELADELRVTDAKSKLMIPDDASDLGPIDYSVAAM